RFQGVLTFLSRVFVVVCIYCLCRTYTVELCPWVLVSCLHHRRARLPVRDTARRDNVPMRSNLGLALIDTALCMFHVQRLPRLGIFFWILNPSVSTNIRVARL
ncbi:unnamed protein product, partial [Ectocarpus sp. 12 AP-2014]